MSSTITSTGTFKTIVASGETNPANEGQSIHEKLIGDGELNAVDKLQTDGMGYQELNQFIGLFAAANSITAMTATVRIRDMCNEIQRQGIPIRSV